MFIEPTWPAPKAVRAYTSLRRGSGFSPAPYDSFNLAYHVADQPELVKANRQLLKQKLQLPEEPVWIDQIHSAIALEACEANSEKEADASFTAFPHKVCVIMTADCLPILLCDQKGREVAAIHAGWRGLAQGIIKNTLMKLKSPRAELLAWLGPAIGPQHFEVGLDVHEVFCKHSPEQQAAFKPSSPGKWLADIYALARFQLKAEGLQQIYGGDYCTYSQEADFFSYRRAKGACGRMASLIWLDP